MNLVGSHEHIGVPDAHLLLQQAVCELIMLQFTKPTQISPDAHTIKNDLKTNSFDSKTEQFMEDFK